MSKPKKIKWTDDNMNDEITPDDGKEGFVYWWQDMRPKEVRLLVKEAYKRGVARGWNECCDRVREAPLEHTDHWDGCRSGCCNTCEALSDFRHITDKDIEEEG